MKFLDTNIFIYAAGDQDARKKRIALDLIRHALEENRDAVISLQVMQEFTNVMLTRSMATAEQIEKWYSYMHRLVASEVTSDMIRNAIEIRNGYRIQYYDAIIIAAAEKYGCSEIVTEDLNDGQLYRGMMAVNPFNGKM